MGGIERGGGFGEGVTMCGRNCSVQSSPAVSGISIDSVDMVQSTQQLLPLQQVLATL